jgi:hypothetical protein
MTNPGSTTDQWRFDELRALFINCTAHGNQRSGWDAGCRFDFANPDYR